MTASPLSTPATGLYGEIPSGLVDLPDAARRFSPLEPGSERLGEVAAESLDAVVLAAPPGTQERRAAMAEALRALKAGGRLTVFAPKTRGGQRLARELAEFGCTPALEARRHHRIATLLRPDAVEGVAAAIAEGAPRYDEGLGLWTQPGIFSFDRIDPGSALLAASLPALSGRGADLGCGLGVLGRAVLAAPRVERLAMVDIDRRAVDMTRRNVVDARAEPVWADLRGSTLGLAGLDFVVTNPPFHLGGQEDRGLGQLFVRRAAEMLRPGGRLWLVANRHLPYEAELGARFASWRPVSNAGGYKIVEARR